MLSYVAALLPQHVPTWNTYPVPCVSNYTHRCIVENSLRMCNIADIIAITDNIDAYYQLVCIDPNFLFICNGSLGKLVKKYKLSAECYRRIVDMYVVYRPKLHSGNILKDMSGWYPDIQEEYISKYASKIIDTRHCFAFPTMDPGGITLDRIFKCIYNHRFEEAEYLLSKTNIDVIDHIDVFYTSIPVLKLALEHAKTPSAKYAIAYDLVYNELAPNIDECIAHSLNEYGDINEELVLLLVKYKHTPIPSRVICWEFLEGMWKLLPPTLDAKCKEICDRLISVLTGQEVYIRGHTETEITHYIRARLVLTGTYINITLDNCDLCNRIRQLYTNY